jgi:hypothetical protein
MNRKLHFAKTIYHLVLHVYFYNQDEHTNSHGESAGVLRPNYPFTHFLAGGLKYLPFLGYCFFVNVWLNMPIQLTV